MNDRKLFSDWGGWIPTGETKAEKRHNLDRLVRYYMEAGHSKVTARLMAKKHLRNR